MKISKLDAARRQLDSAIRLWFADDDPVTICALAWAAYQIIQDINEKKGDKSVTLLELTRAVVNPEHVEEAVRFLKKPTNFFKHANRDPHDILDYNPEMSDCIMLIAIRGLQSLGEQMSDVQRVFSMWQNIHHDNRFLEGSEFLRKLDKAQVLAQLRQVRKRDFLAAGLISIVQARSGHV